MHTGSCLCGAVRYTVRGDIGATVYCHCGRCRKAGGSAFATNAAVAADATLAPYKIQYLYSTVSGHKDVSSVHPLTNKQKKNGADAVTTFSTAEGVHRVFCSRCGSPLISRRDSQPELVRLRVGTLDTPLPGRPGAHIFVASKAAWFDIRDDLPQYPERP